MTDKGNKSVENVKLDLRFREGQILFYIPKCRDNLSSNDLFG